jgi:hypothetical protein
VTRPRFLFEVRDAGIVEVLDAREFPHTAYLGSLPMMSEALAAFVAELAGAAAARFLHRPCHDPQDPAELCTDPSTHLRDDCQSRCRECGKPYPCPTAEVLPR